MSQKSDQFYLWIGLKDKAYKTNPRWNKLRNITNTTSQQFPDKNTRVHNNMFCQYTECILSGHDHFQDLLQHGRVVIRLSKVYYHCDNLCSSLDLLLRLPRCDIRHTGGWGCARKQEMVHRLLRLHDQNNSTLFSQQCHPLQMFFIFYCCVCIVASLISSGRLSFWVNLKTTRRRSPHINEIKNAHTTVYQCDWNVLAKGQFLENTATWSSMVRNPVVM